MSVNNVSILAHLGPAIVNLVNQKSGIISAAPTWLTSSLAGDYSTLRGSGIAAMDARGLYDVKAFGAAASRTALSYGREAYRVDIRRHSRIDYDHIQEAELAREDKDVSADWLRRAVGVASSVHGWEVSRRLAGDAFDSNATSANFDFSDPAASLLAALQAAENFFISQGAAEAGTRLIFLANHNVTQAIGKLLELSETQTIAGVASGDTLVRQGMTSAARIEEFIAEHSTINVPKQWITDRQVVTLDGAPRQILDDDLYVYFINDDEPKASFISTPVYDYSGIDGYAGMLEAVGEIAGALPIGVVYEGPNFDPSGKFHAIEQCFGVAVYGSSDPGTARALGYRFTNVLGGS